VVVCTSRRGARVHLLQSPQIHRRIEQWQDVWVEGLPIRVVQVVLLGLRYTLAMRSNELRTIVVLLTHDQLLG
jgi:hypothetical protein